MLECQNVCVKNIVRNISFTAKKGKTTVIIGKNGSGKTTVAKCIMGERKFDGKVLIDGNCQMTISERSKTMAYLPQSLPSPNITVRELVTLGRTPYSSLVSRLSFADSEAIDKAISDCNLSGFENRTVSSLSGGEKQRAFLAMLLAQETEILLLDEPCAYLDMAASAEFCRLLSGLGKTLIVIMHDLSLAAKYADSLLILDEGKQVFFGSKKDALESSIIEKNFGVRRMGSDKDIVFLV